MALEWLYERGKILISFNFMFHYPITVRQKKAWGKLKEIIKFGICKRISAI